MKAVDHPVITFLLALVLAINSFCFMAVSVQRFYKLNILTFNELFELSMYLLISFAGYLLSIKKFREVQFFQKKAK